MFFTCILTVLAVAFAALLFTRSQPNTAAIIEWVIAFGYTFYLLTFWWDMRGSKDVASGEYGFKDVRSAGTA